MRLVPHIDDSNARRFLLLAPRDHTPSPLQFNNVRQTAQGYEHLLGQVQRLRGGIYLADGAIEPWQLTADGRHVQSVDSRSWHLVILDQQGNVAACTRYTAYDPTVSFSKLGVARCVLAQSDWRPVFEAAVESEFALARERGFTYVEMGGWAVSEALRCTTEAARMVITVYGLAELLGGSLGISTVTTRHCSSSILRRLGGSSLMSKGVEVPSYYDSAYKCQMEILRFDSSQPSDKYASWIDSCRDSLQFVPVVHADDNSLDTTMSIRSLAAALGTVVPTISAGEFVHVHK